MEEVAYLFVDARYEKVREVGQVREAAVLLATGITPAGERQVFPKDIGTMWAALCL